MNFLDAYDVPAPSTPPPGQPEQSLNEEVSQVIGQLGRFWGGFRKQSQTALETARKDFGDVVVQAQKELSKLTTEAPAESTSQEAPSEEKAKAEGEPSSSGGDTTPSSSAPTDREPAATSTPAQTLLSRLQSVIPPNAVAAVQNSLPETLKHASENFDIAQLRTTLSSEFQRVQGITRSQAEEYVHKSEAMLRDAMKEAGEVLRDAVKVVPPEEATGSQSSGLVWDGSDMWMLPSDPSESTETAKGKENASKAVATRAESLLKRLKHDPEILRHDPEADKDVRELYTHWLSTDVDVKDGGIDGEEWSANITKVLGESGDGQALQATRDVLVPSEISQDTFWKRYFFRTHQIEQEEEKRKALIRSSIATEDDFSWEDDEDEVPSPTAKTAIPSNTLKTKSSTTTLQPQDSEPILPVVAAADTAKTSVPPSRTHTPANTSPRDSSEESYDVVSSDVGGSAGKKPSDSDDADSDWE